MEQPKQTPSQSHAKGLPFPKYFSGLAANYAKQTGNSTYDMFALALADIQAAKPITKESRVHDNAAGPGTAASVLVDTLAPEAVPEVLVTDNVPPMVQAARDTLAAWPSVTAREADALDLAAAVPDGHVSHSILNFSVFALADPLQGLREVHRSLQPGGLAALLTWSRFGAGAAIHAAQARVRPDLPPLPMPHPEFLQAGVLERTAVEAGFDAARVRVSQKSVVVSGAKLEGLRGFMLGDLMRPARAGWTDEEEARWPEAVDEALKDEIESYGGVKFEAWVVLADK